MEREYPKNVRQIGNVCDQPRIYVEDYVDTYLNQSADQMGDNPVCIVLLGEIIKKQGESVVYISGALTIPEIQIEDGKIEVSKEMWERTQGEKQVFFENQTMVGWCLVHNGQVFHGDSGIRKFHEKYFKKEDSIFISKDAMSGEEVFYAKKYGDLMEIGGHFIFYEKNPSMQNYLIMARKKIGVTPSEVVEDRAAKDFRSTIKEKMEEKERRKNARWMYGLSAVLVIVVLGIGITMLNNYEGMETIQSSIMKIGKQTEQEAVAENPKEVTVVETKAEMNEETKMSEEEKKEEPDISNQESENEEEEKKKAEEAAQNRVNTDYYQVKRGDTLENISVQFYGNKKMIDQICEINGLADGNLIIEGQKLLLP